MMPHYWMNSCIRRWENEQAAWNMYQPEIWVFSQNNNQSRGQRRAVKIKSDSTATRRHKVRALPSSGATSSRGGSKLCYRGTKSTQTADKVFTVKPTEPASLQWLHVSSAVRVLCVSAAGTQQQMFFWGMICWENVSSLIWFVPISCWVFAHIAACMLKGLVYIATLW